jgi:hypothetical protein
VSRLILVSVLSALALLGIVLELVRRRHLQERYSLLWLLTGVVILIFAVWQRALSELAQAMGIAYPPSALFVLLGGFFLVVLLHYSTVISRLSEQNMRLAQRLALLEERQRADERRVEEEELVR